jgi:hypothetical protein
MNPALLQTFRARKKQTTKMPFFFTDLWHSLVVLDSTDVKLWMMQALTEWRCLCRCLVRCVTPDINSGENYCVCVLRLSQQCSWGFGPMAMWRCVIYEWFLVFWKHCSPSKCQELLAQWLIITFQKAWMLMLPWCVRLQKCDIGMLTGSVSLLLPQAALFHVNTNTF